MSTLIVSDLADDLMESLRLRAARHGRSMEDEARHILRSALATAPSSGRSLVEDIRASVESCGGIELEIPSRELQRDPPDFG